MTSLEHRRRSRPHLDLDRTPGRHRWDEAGSLGSRAPRGHSSPRSARSERRGAVSAWCSSSPRRAPPPSRRRPRWMLRCASRSRGSHKARWWDSCSRPRRRRRWRGSSRSSCVSWRGSPRRGWRARWRRLRPRPRRIARRARLSCPPDATRTTRSRDSKPRRTRRARRGKPPRDVRCRHGCTPQSRSRSAGRGSPPSPAPSPTRRRAWRRSGSRRRRSRAWRRRWRCFGASMEPRWRACARRWRRASANFSPNSTGARSCAAGAPTTTRHPGRGTRRPRTRL